MQVIQKSELISLAEEVLCQVWKALVFAEWWSSDMLSYKKQTKQDRKSCNKVTTWNMQWLSKYSKTKCVQFKASDFLELLKTFGDFLLQKEGA